MPTTTITTKGQVTIPAEIRVSLGLRAGDRLVLEVSDNGFIAVVERPPQPADVRGVFHHAARPGTSRAEERAAYVTELTRQSVS
ncbi:AbrB/MazE/SpoVT family DNA-binding domain-containing protein [Deinococcus frigens]|uniref:AbrB/MazE/SpoVT family DNA-binding domain-containing protein n=1 Tax=Deinococcus frigens TaxID=249403 RepID=UPI00069245FA|nr:AbrB/MazE/SpoVT family DNA-binding domain-containing protein [Deinococcus frigens]